MERAQKVKPFSSCLLRFAIYVSIIIVCAMLGVKGHRVCHVSNCFEIIALKTAGKKEASSSS